MKKLIMLRPASAFLFNFREKLFATAMLSSVIIFMISCQKDISKEFNESITGETKSGDSTVSVAAAAASITYYVSPTGNDNNSGTIDAPFKTLNKAWTVIAAGDLVYLRGGTYSWASSQYLEGKNGTSGNLIKIWAYPGEVPVLTSGSNYSGNDLIEWKGNYIHWKGLEVSNFKGNTTFSAFRSENCNNCIFEQINYHHNPLGFTIRNCNNNLVLNSDFHHNADVAGDNADGINITYISNASYTNTIRGCRAWYNSDDGFDLWSNDGYVLIENSWAWKNGYYSNDAPAGDGSGFKFGEANIATSTLRRTARNCVAWGNKLWGFNENNTPTGIQLYNNTSVANGNKDYWFGDWASNPITVRNNISYLATPTFNSSQTIADHNTWQGGIVVTASDFVNMDNSQLLNARKIDGSLPDISFLHLASGSDMINTGVNVDLPYNSTAPDMGAFESGGTTAPPVNQAPVAYAGADRNITLPVNSASLTGSGTDPDGTIASYAWSFRSGPNTPVLSGFNTPALSASNLIAGSYVFRLTVTDNGGLTAFDEVNVVVGTTGPPANQAPVANAGVDKTITLPVNSVSLTGSGSDPGGTIASYAWTRRSGPSFPVLSGVNTTTLSASNLIAGSYIFRLTVTDNGGLTAYDQVRVTVKASTPPTNQINVSQAVSESGFSYYVVQDFGTLPDIESNQTRSVLRIFENGVELSPAHSLHSDIATLGHGRFSHWGDGSFIVVYFSASDNSDPKTNGRTYTYSITP